MTPQSSPRKVTPHDRFFVTVFGDVDHAKGLILPNVPKEMASSLDMDTLKKLEGPFINPNEDEVRANFAFAAWPKEGEDLGCDFVVFLLEYASAQYPELPQQMALSSMSIRNHFAHQGDDVKVVPILMYTGPGKWSLSRQDIPDDDVRPMEG